jgi:hypothetical protein
MHIDKNVCDIPVPEVVKTEISEYISDNNPLRSYIDEHIETTNNDKDIIEVAEVRKHFNSITGCALTAQKFNEYAKFNNIQEFKSNGRRVFRYMKFKIQQDIDI